MCGAREGKNLGFRKAAGYFIHRLEILPGYSGHARLDAGNAGLNQLFGDVKLILLGEDNPRRLFAIAQSSVVNFYGALGQRLLLNPQVFR